LKSTFADTEKEAKNSLLQFTQSHSLLDVLSQQERQRRDIERQSEISAKESMQAFTCPADRMWDAAAMVARKNAEYTYNAG